MAPLEPERGPIVVRVANCQSVSAGVKKSSRIFAAALSKPGRFGVPDIVLGSECADFAAPLHAANLGLGWTAIQYGFDDGDTAKAGSVLAYRRGDVVRGPRLVVGSKAGEGIRTRYVVQAKLDIDGFGTEWFAAGHAPPDRAPNGQRSWLDRVRLWRGIVGADFNTWPKQLEKRYTRQVRGVEVLALLVPNRYTCSPARPVDIGSDHPAVDVRIHPAK